MRSNFYKLYLLLFSFACAITAQGQVITTFAGMYGTSGATGDGRAATDASIGNPNGITVDKFGNVYVTDGLNNTIRVINSAGRIATFCGAPGGGGYSGDGGAATDATLNNPTGICADASGNIYFADQGNNIVRKVDASTGIISTFAGTAGLAFYSGDGGAATAASLAGAVDVAISGSGMLLIADGFNRIMFVDTFGNIGTFAGGVSGYRGDGGAATAASLLAPTGVTIDKFGNVYIADNQNNVVRLVDATGTITTVAGSLDTTTYASGYSGDGGAATAALMSSPNGIGTDSLGNLYIADMLNNVIRFVNVSTGTISTFAGNATAGYRGDGGLADTAELNNPVYCVVSKLGHLFIADQFNNVIRDVAPPPISITTASLTVCSGHSVSFTANVLVSGVVHYDWMVNGHSIIGDAATITLDSVNSGDSIQCLLLGAGSTDTLGYSNVLTMGVHISVTPTITISANHDSLCTGGSVILSSGVTGGGSSPSFAWYVNGVATSGHSATYSYSPADSDVVHCELTSSLGCVTTSPVHSLPLTLRVLPVLSPSIIISAISDTVCDGAMAYLSAAVINAGPAPTYIWQVGGLHMGADTSVYSYIPATGDLVTCVLVSDYLCPSHDSTTSNTITMAVRSRVVPTVTASSTGGDTTCAGSSVTLTASSTYGGSTPIYRWKSGSVYIGIGDTFTYSPSSDAVIRCVMASSATCRSMDTVISDSIKISVIGVSTPSVSTTVSADTVCHGTTVSFTATGINGGGSPVYDWYRNGIHIAVGSSYSYSAVSSGDSVYCILRSSAACATPDTAMSAVTHIVVNALVTPSVSITASPSGAICAGTTVTYTATPVSGGTAPGYIWYKNGIGVGTGSTFTFSTAATGDTIKCILISDAPCATPDTVTSNAIVMSVIPLVTPTIAISVSPNDTICAGTSVTFRDTITNGGSAPAYQWRKNGTIVATTASYTVTPLNGDTVSCTLISSAACATPDTVRSSVIKMTVNPIVTPAMLISAAPSGAVCAGTTVNFTSIAINEGSAPAYQWRVNGVNVGSDTTTYSYTPANGDTVYCKLTSSAGCLTSDSANSNVIHMLVNPVGAPTISIAVTPGDTICAGTTATYRSTYTFGGSAPSFKWIKNGVVSGFSSVYVDTPVAGDSVYCVITSNAPCTTLDTARSNTILIHITPLSTPMATVTASNDSVCAGTRVTYSVTAVNGGSAPVFHWKVNTFYTAAGSSYSYTPANGDRVKCILVSSLPCASPDSVISDTVTMRVFPIIRPSVTITPNHDTVCAGSAVIFTANADSAGSAPVYEWRVNGVYETNINPYTYTPTATDAISCTIISNATCASPDSVADTSRIIVEAIDTPNVTITATPGTTVRYGTSITFNTAVTHGGTTGYQWEVNGVPVPGATNSTYVTDTLTYGANVTCIITSNQPCISRPTDTSNVLTIVISNVGVPLVTSIGDNLQLLPNPNNGTFILKGNLGASNTTSAEITVTDMLGKNVYQANVPVDKGIINSTVNLDNNLATGMYLLHFSSEYGSGVIHFVVSK